MAREKTLQTLDADTGQHGHQQRGIADVRRGRRNSIDLLGLDREKLERRRPNGSGLGCIHRIDGDAREGALAACDGTLRSTDDRQNALSALDAEHVGLMYWTAAAWAAAVGLDKGQADLAADMGVVEALILRARALDLDYGEGALHDFMVAWDGGRPASAGGSVERAKKHFENALVASNHQRIAPLVGYAETICVKEQDAEKFATLLNKALDFDVDSAPRHRLANLIAQKRARWLLNQKEDLFL